MNWSNTREYLWGGLKNRVANVQGSTPKKSTRASMQCIQGILGTALFGKRDNNTSTALIGGIHAFDFTEGPKRRSNGVVRESHSGPTVGHEEVGAQLPLCSLGTPKSCQTHERCYSASLQIISGILFITFRFKLILHAQLLPNIISLIFSFLTQ